MVKRVTDVGEIRWYLSEKGTTCYLCGEASLHYSGAILENVDPISPNEVVILCRDCSARRRKAPISAYIAKRFSKVATEYANLAVLLGEFKGVSVAPNSANKSVSARPNTTPKLDDAAEKARLDALVGDWDEDEEPTRIAAKELVSDDVLIKIAPDDPRLDPESAMFDAELYDRYLDM